MTPGPRLAASCASIVLALVLAGCSDGDGGGGDGGGGGGSDESTAPTETTTATDLEEPVAPESDGSAGQSELGTGAEVDELCAVLAEIDDSIDDARPDNDDDWLRIVAAFDALWTTGTPADFPEEGRTELVAVDRLVRQSDDVEEFLTATERESPEGFPVVDDWIDAHCED